MSRDTRRAYDGGRLRPAARRPPARPASDRRRRRLEEATHRAISHAHRPRLRDSAPWVE
jgi:hypothetical protein